MKKRSIVVVVLFYLFSENSLFAQSQELVKPDFSEWGVSFRALGIGALKDDPFKQAFDSVSLNIKYTKNERIFYRLGLGIESGSKSTEKRDSTGPFTSKNYTVSTTSESKTSISITPGLEYHFKGSSRLDPYIGGEIAIKLIGGQTNTDDEKKEGISNNKKISVMNNTENFTAGGFGFGVGLLVGFNYFITERFALGLEYNINFDWVSEGGESRYTSTTETNNGGIITRTEDISTNFSKQKNFNAETGEFWD